VSASTTWLQDCSFRFPRGKSSYDLEVAKEAIAGKLDREVEVLRAA